MTTEPDDAGLVHRAAAGDGEAFGVLVDRHARWLLGRVAGRLGRRADAEDLVQETLLAAYRQLPRLKDPARFGAWLAGIADNQVRMWHRRRAVQLRWLEANGDDGADRVEMDESEAPAAVRSSIRHALARLTPRQRQVIVHHYLKGYSYQQVAEFLGIETATVRSRLQNARGRLREEMIAMSDRAVKPMRFELNGRDAGALRSAAGFASRDPGRSVLQAICLDAGGWLVATDGSRLFRWRAEGLASLTAPVLLGPWSGVELTGEREPVRLSLQEDEATLSTSGTDVTVGVMQGPYVKYEEAVGEPGPVEVRMPGRRFQASLEEIEPFLVPRHPLTGLSGWDYRPVVRVTVSLLEQSVELATSSDLGYTSPADEGLSGEVAGPPWEFSTQTMADVRGLERGEVHRFGVNVEYLEDAMRALDLAAEEEVRMHLSDERPAIHFTVPAGPHRSAVVMPVRLVEKPPG